MRRFLLPAGLSSFLVLGHVARGQTSLDVIQDDMRTAKEQHDQASSALMTSFLGALDQASQSAAAAIDLYQKAGGSLPDAEPVRSHYEYETPTEKAAREAEDMQNYQAVAVVIQVHCGLMRQAALLAVNPKKADVRAQWLEWLKATAPIYPQLAGKRALKDVAMRDSVVSRYLGFDGWGESESGKWTVSDLPKLYHDLVLAPLRHTPTQATLDAWDAYIAMRQADAADHDKWTQEDEPGLAFDRGADDFAISPTMDKLATLDAIVKGSPGSSHLDDWLSRMQGMIALYRQGGTNHSQLPGATPGTPSSETAGLSPTATPGTPSSDASGPQTVATPGSPSSETAGVSPTATPGATPEPGAAPVPAATPGTPSSSAAGPLPAPTPGTPSSGTTAPSSP